MMEITKEIMDRLHKLQHWDMGFSLFATLFNRGGENPNDEHSLASHMWRKFRALDNNLLSFWMQCDTFNKESILNYLKNN